MSTSKVIFNIPTKIKKAAAKRAEREGLTLTTIFAQAAQAYAEGKIGMQIVETPTFRPEIARQLRQAAVEVKKGQSVGPFSAQEASAYLRSLMK